MKRLFPYLLSLLMACGSLEATAQTETLTNQSIIDLTTLGLPPSVVVNKIKTTANTFDVSINGLIALKQKNISDTIINAMIEYSGKPAAVVPAVEAANPNDPLSAHPAGIYYYQPKDSQLIQLTPTLSNETKSNTAAMAFSYGLAKAKTKKSVSGLSARTKLKNNKPTFYFYIPESDQGNMAFNSSFTATSPNDFLLIQFVPNPKQNEREIIVGSFNAYSSQSGVDNSKTFPFEFVKKKSGIYEVTLSKPLELGEYAFMYANNNVSRVFDFSIQPAH